MHSSESNGIQLGLGDEVKGAHTWQVPEGVVPAYAPTLQNLEALKADWFHHSMICEKQFVPSDDQFLYCSEE